MQQLVGGLVRNVMADQVKKKNRCGKENKENKKKEKIYGGERKKERKNEIYEKKTE